jgi:hypothetical protein
MHRQVVGGHGGGGGSETTFAQTFCHCHHHYFYFYFYFHCRRSLPLGERVPSTKHFKLQMVQDSSQTSERKS